MLKVIVFYDTKYGNTKFVAEKVVEGIRSIEDIEVNQGYVKEVSVEHALDYDLIVFGAPNHMGRPSRTMKKFIDGLAELNLSDKKVAVFGTYSGRSRQIDRSVKKLEKTVETKLPNLKLILPSLSVQVKGVKGPVLADQFSKCIDFGKQLALQLK